MDVAASNGVLAVTADAYTSVLVGLFDLPWWAMGVLFLLLVVLVVVYFVLRNRREDDD